MSADNLWNTFPPDLMYQVERGSYCQTCDLGYCNGKTHGWAIDLKRAHWLTGCAPCLLRSVRNGVSIVLLANVEAVMESIPAGAAQVSEPDGDA